MGSKRNSYLTHAIASSTNYKDIPKALFRSILTLDKSDEDFSKMYDAIINKNPEVFEEELADVLLETISFNDAYENFYHGFVTGVLSNMKRYLIKSNRESGKGRSDIIIRAVSRRGAAVILELKAAKSFDELEKKAD